MACQPYFYHFYRHRGLKKNDTRNFGYPCNKCQDFLASGANLFLKNKRNMLCTCASLFETTQKICDGSKVLIRTNNTWKFACLVLNIQSCFLYEKGMKHRAQLATTKQSLKPDVFLSTSATVTRSVIL